MKVRDSHSTINGNDDVFEMPSGGLDIIADDGRKLFGLSLKENELHIDSGSVCKHGEVILDDRFVIRPVAANCVDLIKVPYEE